MRRRKKVFQSSAVVEGLEGTSLWGMLAAAVFEAWRDCFEGVLIDLAMRFDCGDRDLASDAIRHFEMVVVNDRDATVGAFWQARRRPTCVVWDVSIFTGGRDEWSATCTDFWRQRSPAVQLEACWPGFVPVQSEVTKFTVNAPN